MDAARDSIPASGLLGITLDQLDAVRAEARADVMTINRRLSWILLAMTLATILFAAAAFSLVIRNNLVILPDRARKPEPAAKPAARTDSFPRGAAYAAGLPDATTPAGAGFIGSCARGERGTA